MLLVTTVAAERVAADWDARVFNPKSLPDDVTLPMPCTGRMAFRRVETESAGIIGDQLIRLGDTDSAMGYREGSLEFPISGGFRDRAQRTRYYLLGKYEVTRQQYQSLVSAQCPEGLVDGQLPQSELSWLEAVDFADRYSRWLLKNAPDSLPQDGASIAYVRLPTETEWEFAARGGLKVSGSATDFQARTFPMTDAMNRYVWYSGADSVNDGKVRAIGLLEPNPLGLYDMLGNLDEMALDLFRLRLHSRVHGQAGGYVVRGGNYITSADEIRSSLRQEVPFYRGSEPIRAKTTGIRLAIGSPVLNREKSKEIGEQRDAIRAVPQPSVREKEKPAPATENKRVAEAERRIGEITILLDQCRREHTPNALVACPGPASRLTETSLPDPLADLRDIAAHADAPVLKARLDQLRVSLATAIESRDERLDQAAREALRAAGLLCLKLKDDFNQVVVKNTALATAFQCGTPQAQAKCRELDLKIKEDERKLEFNKGIYADSLVRLAQTYPVTVLERQQAFLMADLERREFKDFGRFVGRAYEQVQRFAWDGKPARDLWSKECESIRVQ